LRALHQFVPTFESGAVGTHTIELQRLAREDLGVDSEIFSEFVKPPLAGKAHHFRDYGKRLAASKEDVLVYQMAIGSNVADFVAQRTEALVVNHHNLTPAWFTEPWAPGVSYGTSWGEAQLRELAPRTALGVAVSAFNQRDLVTAGYCRTAVVPVLVDYDGMRAEADDELESRLRAAKEDGGADWLFAGRISPHKCQHDLIKAFAVYRRVYDPAARLWLVGASSADRYVEALEQFVAEIGLQDAVTITGRVSPAVLETHYRTADAFVCLSEHEGFCTPLIEAMGHDLPVVAFASSAIPETLGWPPAGLLLRDKSPAAVAAAVHRAVTDRLVRSALVDAGRERAEHFSLANTRARFVEVLKDLG
jgi:glycosyltransferase involved in cell wall biosynthesis